jgi:hypothetical protein
MSPQEESCSVSIWTLSTVINENECFCREGSVIWYIKQLVTSRAIRFTIGVETGTLYDPTNQIHRSRKKFIIKDPMYVKAKLISLDANE